MIKKSLILTLILLGCNGNEWNTEYAKEWERDSLDVCIHGVDPSYGVSLSQMVGFQLAEEFCICGIEKFKNKYSSPDAADQAAENLSDADYDEIINVCLQLLE